MLTDEQRAAMRRPFLADIDDLMRPGVNIEPSHSRWLTQRRQAFFVDQTRVPGDGDRSYIRRMQIACGIRAKSPVYQTRAARRAAERATEHHPEASTPAGLQGSRKPTPMPPWLGTGKGLPMRPPTRRQAVSP